MPATNCTRAALQATPDTFTRKDTVAAPQVCTEPSWRRGGEIPAEFRGRSRPPRNLSSQTTPQDGVPGNKSASCRDPSTHFNDPRITRRAATATTPNGTDTPQLIKPQSTITPSFDGLVGQVSYELPILASPRSNRCLYVIKTLDVRQKNVVGLQSPFIYH